MAMKQRSARIDGRVVPVAAFIDWPTDVMTDYPIAACFGEIGLLADDVPRPWPATVYREYASG